MTFQDDHWADLIDEYTSPSSVRQAMSEKSMASDADGGSVTFGNFPKAQRELDLHGLTGQEAERSTENFLKNAAHQCLRTVRLITGKGIHSKKQSVLPGLVNQLLLDLKRQNKIVGFKWEKGRGSVLVYLA